tara:strand:- start:2253 stop:3131 length:879 start_codon:yes stop_codon:yes gene_type:complete
MARILYLLCTFIVGCQADYSVVEKNILEAVSDSFIQASKTGSLDILVVLDTSGSMNDNFETVGEGMQSLKSDIELLTDDYQFGFITTDPDRLGLQGPYDSRSTDIDLLMAPSLLPPVAREEGFAAAYTLARQDTEYNFFRTDADLLIFFISDEEEQSAISSQMFYDWLHEFKKHARVDAVSIVTLEDSVCNTGWGDTIGYKYMELSRLFHKSALDICDKEWSSWVSESSFLTMLKDYIVLTSYPEVGSIKVYVDGEELKSAWSYSKNQNTIYLDDMPDYGSYVVATYLVEER